MYIKIFFKIKPQFLINAVISLFSLLRPRSERKKPGRYQNLLVGGGGGGGGLMVKILTFRNIYMKEDDSNFFY